MGSNVLKLIIKDTLFSCKREIEGSNQETNSAKNRVHCTVEPRYNEVSRYRQKCSFLRGLRYNELSG